MTKAPAFNIEVYSEPRAPALARHTCGETALFDDFGTGFTLLRIGTAPPEAKALIEAAAARRLPLKVVDVPESEAWRKYECYGLIIVRPDQFICWRSRTEPSDADARALLDRITGRLVKSR
ncbi:hypothetical protein [Variovorax guangxiensis]|uniref:aromatic-ring hydroxylase C-terminal domain-containing protein n=1 Tax=Variovorax guangxiensis TaxID=1775474 RepID=UPI0028570FCA|nr:hypothetical protein [Variovorax guangxiensis]MDR6860890.1 hypothetical protein [Variovorax guangxiensis]